MSEERFIDMETRLAHQDQLMIELNEVVTEQQVKIMQLEQLCASLVERVKAMGESIPGDASQDDRPPHY